MKIARILSRHAILALCAAGMFCAQTIPSRSFATEQPIVVAQADCYAVGQQIAAQNGGTLAKASRSDQGGQTVCVIVVLVPGKDGQRPRREEYVVPAD